MIENKADANALSLGLDRHIHAAAENGAVDVVKVLIENGVDVNSKSKYGDSPIHSAAQEGVFH